MNRCAGLVAAVALYVCMPVSVHAQYVSREVPRAGTVEVGATATWITGRSLGTVTATETSNPGVTSNPLGLFVTDAKVRPSVGIEGQVGVYLSPAVELEGTASFTRPVVSVHLSDDFESAADTTAEKTVTHYLIGGSALYHFGRGRLKPFVFGGGAYLRQLEADAAAVQNGTELHAGGGIKYWFGQGRRRSGLRIDARLSARNRSAGFDPMEHATVAVVSAGFAVQF